MGPEAKPRTTCMMQTLWLKLRTNIKHAEGELAEVEKQIKALKEYRYPTEEQKERITGLVTKTSGAQINVVYADSEAKKAEHDERPKAAADARRRKLEAEGEYAQARKELNAALVKLGFAPNAL